MTIIFKKLTKSQTKIIIKMRTLKPGTKVVPFQNTTGITYEKDLKEVMGEIKYLYVSCSYAEGKQYILKDTNPNLSEPLGMGLLFNREDFKLYRERKPIEIKEGVYYRLKPIKQLLKEKLIERESNGRLYSTRGESSLFGDKLLIHEDMVETWEKPVKVVKIDKGRKRVRCGVYSNGFCWYYCNEWLQKRSIIN